MHKGQYSNTWLRTIIGYTTSHMLVLGVFFFSFSFFKIINMFSVLRLKLTLDFFDRYQY
jgi:hypothetical protein